ncbi:hypothetical protein M0R45_035561 [Rubus argutus]|uniref:Uncharacterized protein n=1 Tax=Rubus argutus TaxID=59490 RepID=A0AAW1VX96_RUBAR
MAMELPPDDMEVDLNRVFNKSDRAMKIIRHNARQYNSMGVRRFLYYRVYSVRDVLKIQEREERDVVLIAPITMPGTLQMRIQEVADHLGMTLVVFPSWRRFDRRMKKLYRSTPFSRRYWNSCMAAIGKMKKRWAKIRNSERRNYLRHEFPPQSTDMMVQYARELARSYINSNDEEIRFRTVSSWRELSKIADSTFFEIGDDGSSLDKKVLEVPDAVPQNEFNKIAVIGPIFLFAGVLRKIQNRPGAGAGAASEL